MRWIFVVAIFLCLTPKSVLAQQIAAEHFRIILDSSSGRKPSKNKKAKKEYEKSFQTACKKLGEAMTVGKGPWGFGAFSSFGCYQGKKKVAGIEKNSKWEMSIVHGKKNIEFNVIYKSDTGTTINIATVEQPASDSFFKFFLDDEFTDILAFSLLERLPMGIQVVKASIKGSPPQFNGRYIRAGKSADFKFSTPMPPEEIVLFRLAWDEQAKAWRSSVVGIAKQVRIDEPKKKKRKKKKGVSLQGGAVVYEISEDVSQLLSQGPVWGQGSDGPSARSEELEEIIAEANTKFQEAESNGSLLDYINGKSTGVFDKLLSTAASGYIAARYGIQVLSGDPLLAKISTFGLLFEMRGGPAKGLRYYYDKVPRVEANQELSKLADENTPDKTSLESARHVLGFSVDFNPGFLFDRVTIDPKLGMWTFSAVLPADVDSEGKVISVKSFELGSTFSVALEVGLELLSDWYTLRGWYSIDSGFSLIKTGGQVTSNRFGIDTYFTAGPSFPIFGIPFKTALLAFFVFENVALEAGDPKEAQAGDKEITGIEYSGGFAGGGIGVTW